jgi:glycogen debranching enzyme
VDPPIAAVEVQGYVYAAKVGLAELFERRGDPEEASRLRMEADRLRTAFNRDFWVEEEGFLAQALDPEKRPIAAITSNPGHCLYTGIVDSDKAARVVNRLLENDMTAGWGIRTISSKATQFNPMSYHNGSVWPHDNAIVAAGMKRYGFDDGVIEILSQMFAAGTRFRYFRLPELFCGFGRETRFFSVPAEYPVRCSPQAWAAGAPLLMLQACLGLSPDAGLNRLYVRPKLPSWLTGVTVRNLRVGKNRIDLRVEQVDDESQVTTLLNEGNLDVLIDIATANMV